MRTSLLRPLLLALPIALLSTLVAEPAARAEDPVVGTGKGIVGGALLGGEVVTFGLGIAGVEDGWPYLVFSAAGAVGGGIGGYFIESNTDAEVPIYLLAGGMALVIPAVVVALDATRYRPPAGTEDEMKPTGAPPQPGLTVTTAQLEAPPALPPVSLVDVREGSFSVGLPLVSVAPTYSRRELAELGVTQHAELRLPLVSAQF
jgi:hypothetical protein